MDHTGTTIHGWTVSEPITKWWRGNFIHIYKIRRLCAQCGTEISMDVTKAAIEGTAKNSGFNITRCTACRISAPARTGNSRPTVASNPPPAELPPAPVEDTLSDLEAELRSDLFQARKKIADLERQLRANTKAFNPHEALRLHLGKKLPW